MITDIIAQPIAKDYTGCRMCWYCYGYRRESRTVEPCSNSGLVCCIHFALISFEKKTHEPYSATPIYGLNSSIPETVYLWVAAI